MTSQHLLSAYRSTRSRSTEICSPLEIEDYVVQPVAFVSPPKWHLGHTTWFFETFLLLPYLDGYRVYDKRYPYVFNSYYEGAGTRVMQSDRGNLSRPSVASVYKYREHVDQHMEILLQQDDLTQAAHATLKIGLAHEEQHQELLLTDIKYILGHNPLWPTYSKDHEDPYSSANGGYLIKAGLYDIGHNGSGFAFDNEYPLHKAYLAECTIARSLVTNGSYLDFIKDGGYTDYRHWLSEGWQWINKNDIKAPLYWYEIDGEWQHYTLKGMVPMDLAAPVTHISYYEAEAYARWASKRLPTEEEWEVAADHLSWGSRWEWTTSSYSPYPGYQPLPGTIGEYNGKFMVSQQVLRGASVATAPNHSRKTYRNFFHPWYRWQYTGIRLCDISTPLNIPEKG